MKSNIFKKALVASLIVTTLSGCIAIPVAGFINNAHKSGTATYEIVGKGNAIAAFKKSAINHGAIVKITGDVATAEFRHESVRVDLQNVSGSSWQIVGGSLDSVGRTFDLEDKVSILTKAVADDMAKFGFQVITSERKRNINI